MRRQRLILAVLVLTATLLPTAAFGQTSTVEQPKAASLAANARHLQQHQAEVQSLQKAVEKQESESAQAASRLKQQDQAIERLRQQLQSATPAAGAH